MNVFAIGDLHLSFRSDKPMNKFGPHWEEHAARIAENWKNEITEQDVVLIPGDISWALRLKEAEEDLKWLNGLPGRKICIRGNHDYWWDRPGKLNQAYDQITFLQSTSVLLGSHAICGTRGWECPPLEQKTVDEENKRMIERELIRLRLSLDSAMKHSASEIWVMLHYPPAFMGEASSDFITLMKSYPVTRVIYGHLHDEASWKAALQGVYDGIAYQLVSADYLDFSPRWIASIDT